MSKTVGIIGLGLLGGSLAKALKAYTDYEVVGYARRQEVCDAAIQDGVVKAAWTEVEPLIENSDIVVFSLPPDTNARLFTETAHLFRPGQVVTDVSSAKENFVRAVYSSIPKGTIFVSVHPMAGSEKTGYENSGSSIIKDARYIITPTKETKPEKIEFMKQFASDVGMRPIVMDYHVHDKSVAAISHVPHLLSTALVHVVSDNDDEEKHMQLLAAGCFRDMSRVAASSPEMWEQICLTNSSAISNILEQYIKMLETIKDNIDKKTPGYVASLFEMSREYRNSLESRHPEH